MIFLQNVHVYFQISRLNSCICAYGHFRRIYGFSIFFPSFQNITKGNICVRFLLNVFSGDVSENGHCSHFKIFLQNRYMDSGNKDFSIFVAFVVNEECKANRQDWKKE